MQIYILYTHTFYLIYDMYQVYIDVSKSDVIVASYLLIFSFFKLKGEYFILVCLILNLYNSH